MNDQTDANAHTRQSKFFDSWYIVGVGMLLNIAGTFAFSSTLSIFLKPTTEELGVSRGAFSLIRTFEIGGAAGQLQDVVYDLFLRALHVGVLDLTGEIPEEMTSRSGLSETINCSAALILLKFQA